MIVRSTLSGIVYKDVYLQDGFYLSTSDDNLELDAHFGEILETEEGAEE